MQSRRGFLGSMGAGLALASGLPAGIAPVEATRRPNFLVILCDDLGYGDLACYGNPVIQTPHLDRLAADGLRLTDCYAAAPVCSPARAGMITGRNPYRCGIPDWIPEQSPVRLLPDEPSVAKLLRGDGYRTGHCGKWHLSGTLDGSQPTPGDHGFDQWFSTQNNALPNHQNPVNFVRNGGSVGPLEGYSSTIIADEAIKLMQQWKEDPFAIFVWFHAPHEPIATAPEFVDLYGAVENKNRATHYGNVTQMDHEVGRLVQAVEQLGLAQETLVYFTSDNGPETLNRYKGSQHSYGSPGLLRGMKLHLHEGGIRVPGIARWTGTIDAAQTSRVPVNGTDLLPTLCALAGTPCAVDKVLDGRDVSAALLGPADAMERPLYWRYDKALSQAKRALRKGCWKILADATWEGIELYNLVEDPAESANLVASHPDQARDLLEALRAMDAAVDGEYHASAARMS